MVRREGTKLGVPLDPDHTLYETGSREVWQSTLVTSDGQEIGPVIRQVIEPGMYTIRYFVVYDLARERHILVPSNTVIDIQDARVYCAMSATEIAGVPSFMQSLNRGYEQEVYAAAGRTPYWIEEAAITPTHPDHDE